MAIETRPGSESVKRNALPRFGAARRLAARFTTVCPFATLIFSPLGETWWSLMVTSSSTASSAAAEALVDGLVDGLLAEGLADALPAGVLLAEELLGALAEVLGAALTDGLLVQPLSRATALAAVTASSAQDRGNLGMTAFLDQIRTNGTCGEHNPAVVHDLTAGCAPSRCTNARDDAFPIYVGDRGVPRSARRLVRLFAATDPVGLGSTVEPQPDRTVEEEHRCRSD